MSQNNPNYNPYQMQPNGFQVPQQQYYYYPTSTPYVIPQQQQVQFPSQSQPNRQANIRGRIINSEAEILPQEIPMDGTVSLFPMADFSCIFAKKWLSNGTIETQKYVLAIDVSPKPESNQPDVYNMIDERFGKLEGVINALVESFK